MNKQLLNWAFWLLILIICGMGTFKILQEALALYTRSSVSYSADTNYLTFDTPFPAVTVCELETDRLKNYLTTKNLSTTLSLFLKDVVYYNTKYCWKCVTCTNTTCVENFLEIVNDYRLKCKEMLRDCWYAGKPFECCARFLPQQTEYGKCFVFNSQRANDSIHTVNRRTGLPSLIFRAIRGVTVRIQSPTDEVSTKVENILGLKGAMPLVTNFTAILKAQVTTSDKSVRHLDRGQRDCLLENERPDFATLWPFQRYSYSACVLYCRTIRQKEQCNCTHHFMPELRGVDICDIRGLACLYKVKEKFLLNDNCGCPMACEETIYEAIQVLNNRDDDAPVEVQTRGSKALVRLNALPSVRIRRHAFRDKLSFVVDIGGVFGVFFGASLLSVTEILYLLCIRRGP